MLTKRLTIGLTAFITSLAACSGGQEAAASTSSREPAAEAAAAAPAPTGHVITVEMSTDGTGNFFTPAELTAKRGDVIRFVLGAGVHNVNFPADSNGGAKNLPPASTLLQLPGQSIDIPVNMEPGRYYFHCDPHALLGMVGHLTVTE